MITKFDKGGIAAHFKKKFSECIREFDYEGAIDYLLKYRDEKHNADFHLACGMLYLQMCLDSDDNELVCLAYRELMMYISRNPDCTKAYRDLLAAILLRRDGVAFVECCKWLKARNIDFGEVISDLAECGALFISSEDGPPDFDMLFDGEYGEIESGVGGNGDCDFSDDDKQDDKKPTSKIIAFGGKPTGDDARRVNSVVAEKDWLTGAFSGEGDDIFALEETLVEGERGADKSDGYEFNDFINAYLYGDEYDDNDAEVVLDAANSEGSESIVQVTPNFAHDEIHAAEAAYDRGDMDRALDILANIKKSDERYYFALTMRALICIEIERFDEAEKLLDEAEGMKPHGALGGALLCQLYRAEGKTELIPAVLKNIDVKDYVNTAHLYKSFDMALNYCDEKTAAELLESYIDEFNIMEMRLIHAQIMYNLGERDYATDEMYKLSRIFYDDINAKLLYMTARSRVEKFMVTAEAPQSVLAAIVENLLSIVLSGELDDEVLSNEMFLYALEFFLTLEYRNDKRLLIKMFDAVRVIASDDRLEDRMRDSLVSPYVEPIVKAIVLGELLAIAPTKPFLTERAYCPISSDCVKTLDGGLSPGYYIAYAFVLMLCEKRIDDLVELAQKTELDVDGVTEECKAYYLITSACGNDLKDDRLPLALGYKTKAAATRERKKIEQVLR
ncbi:MAG: hypothetical protein J1G38_05345 [Clostridiales bacterium]|nr:hypothetical protein [Clostridiales bacterium]